MLFKNLLIATGLAGIMAISLYGIYVVIKSNDIATLIMPNDKQEKFLSSISKLPSEPPKSNEMEIK